MSRSPGSDESSSHGFSTEELENLERTVDDDADDDDDIRPPDQDSGQTFLDMLEKGCEPDGEGLAEREKRDQRLRHLREQIQQGRQESFEERQKPTGPSSVSGAARRRRIRYVAPGVKLFSPTDFLRSFEASQLSLERDFGYSKRPQLLKLGLSEETAGKILGDDPEAFLMHLSPEANSVLISDANDFAQICEYLFFSCASCCQPLRRELLKKALVDLLKNYAYKWKLQLKHVITALVNLGANNEAVRPDKHLANAMRSHISVAKKAKSATERCFKFSLPQNHAIHSPEIESGVVRSYEEDVRLDVIKSFVELLTDVVVGHPECTDFQPAFDDWAKQLVFLYLIALVVTDRDLINDPGVCQNVQMIIHSQLDSFSSFQWSGEEAHRPKEHWAFLPEESLSHETANALCDVSEILAHVANGEDSREAIRNWATDDVPTLPHFQEIDHHHNMVARLQLIPPSYRGNQVKKNVAYLHLQQLLNNDKILLATRADIGDAFSVLTKNNVLLGRLFDEHYTMFNVVRLLDMLAGAEPEDYTRRKCEHLNCVRDFLNNYAQKNWKRTEEDTSTLNELLAQVISKWSIIQSRHTEDNV